MVSADSFCKQFGPVSGRYHYMSGQILDGPRSVFVSMIRIQRIVTLATLKQLNDYHIIVAKLKTDHLGDHHLGSLFGLGS